MGRSRREPRSRSRCRSTTGPDRFPRLRIASANRPAFVHLGGVNGGTLVEFPGVDAPEAEGVYWNRRNPPSAITLPPVQLIPGAESDENVYRRGVGERAVRVDPRALRRGADGHHQVLLLVGDPGSHLAPRRAGVRVRRRARRSAGEDAPRPRGCSRRRGTGTRSRSGIADGRSRRTRRSSTTGGRPAPRSTPCSASPPPTSPATRSARARPSIWPARRRSDGYRQLWDEQPRTGSGGRSPASCACSRSCGSSSRPSGRSGSWTRRCTPESRSTGSGWPPSRACCATAWTPSPTPR